MGGTWGRGGLTNFKPHHLPGVTCRLDEINTHKGNVFFGTQPFLALTQSLAYRVESPTTGHLRDSTPNIAKYKAV